MRFTSPAMTGALRAAVQNPARLAAQVRCLLVSLEPNSININVSNHHARILETNSRWHASLC